MAGSGLARRKKARGSVTLLRFLSTQVIGDFAELFEGGFEVVDDFLGENVGIGKIVGVFEAFVSNSEVSLRPQQTSVRDFSFLNRTNLRGG